MTKQKQLIESLQSESRFELLSIDQDFKEVTVVCGLNTIIPFLEELKKNDSYCFDQLIDLCVVDYLTYGESDWETLAASELGFSRAVEKPSDLSPFDRPHFKLSAEREGDEINDGQRFAVIYHLLSTVKNHRIRVKVFCSDKNNIVPSVHNIWKGANWFEREAYDLYGILFTGHPDLRRILTDYGFIGHPFRKDFPVSGHVEMRYDAKLQKVIYEPVDIVPRILEPKVIRCDNRNRDQEGKSK